MARTEVHAETFTAADNTNIESLSGWSAVYTGGGYAVVKSNRLSLAFSETTHSVFRRNTGSYGAAQYAKLTVISKGADEGARLALGVVTQCSADTGASRDYYAWWHDLFSDTAYLDKVVNGTVYTIDSRSLTIANSDTFSLESNTDGTLICYVNDVQSFSTTDDGSSYGGAVLSGGTPGLLIRGYANVPTADDWSGGNGSLAGGGGGGSTNGIAFGARGGRALNASKTFVGGIRRAALQRAHEVGDRIAAAVQRERFTFGEQLLAGINS